MATDETPDTTDSPTLVEWAKQSIEAMHDRPAVPDDFARLEDMVKELPGTCSICGAYREGRRFIHAPWCRGGHDGGEHCAPPVGRAEDQPNRGGRDG